MATLTGSAVREEIAAANERFVDAFGRGDADGVAACYTADGQLLPANSDIVQGPAAITTFWRGVMGTGITGARLQSLEVQGESDFAYEVGRYTLTAGGGQEADRGKYVVIWRREGARWKIHRDIWTTSLPSQTPA